MDIQVFDTYEELSRRAADIVIGQVHQKRKLVLGTATGNSPRRAYTLLGQYALRSPFSFNEMSVVKLDEWLGLPMVHPATCETYLRELVLEPLGITDDRYVSFRSDTGDPERECYVIQHALERMGHMDICVLGMGVNGHIAFNEPATFLQPHCHVAALMESSQSHSMVSEINNKPTMGLTLGMADIFTSRMILLLISGKSKREATDALLSKRITPLLPVSMLWLHPNAVCLMDRDAYEP